MYNIKITCQSFVALYKGGLGLLLVLLNTSTLLSLFNVTFPVKTN